ncbi:MAG: hypothetical protein V1928_01630 [Parcubacteria group bacterium]
MDTAELIVINNDKMNEFVLHVLEIGRQHGILMPTPDGLISEQWICDVLHPQIIDEMKNNAEHLVREIFTLRIGRNMASEWEFLYEGMAILRLYYFNAAWHNAIKNFICKEKLPGNMFYLFLAVYLKNLATGELAGGKQIIKQRNREIELIES